MTTSDTPTEVIDLEAHQPNQGKDLPCPIPLQPGEVYEHHEIMERIVDQVCTKTQNTDRKFFRVVSAYFLSKMAASMRTVLTTKDRGEIPVNVYALALAVSGSGKGFSVNLLENQFLMGFQERFLEETFPVIADQHLWDLANKRAARNATDPNEEHESIEREFQSCGALAFTFDSGTVPAVRQMRQKLLMAKLGSINFQVDEIGSNITDPIVNDILKIFLELYDQGLVKQKLTKNTNDSKRTEEIVGKTPANMLLFGTPSKLLDGAGTEDHFFSLLDTGYARRCIFAFGHRIRSAQVYTPEEVYRTLTQKTNEHAIGLISQHFVNLADPTKVNWNIEVPDPVAIRLLEYKFWCEAQADQLPEHEEIKKAEITHRYFKVLKLAGTFAFVDEELVLSMRNLLSAIKLVEESGAAFQELLSREKPYVKLAKYLADVGTEQTHADLHEALPYYKSAAGARNEMMTLATAWGYRQHIMIKKSYVDGIEFFKGETLEKTDLDNLKVGYSNHFAYHYVNDSISFDDLGALAQMPDYGWINHHVRNNHRLEENIVPGFNLVVLDVDSGTSLISAQELLSEYKYMIYTTKRHTETENRFRLIMPMNYVLKLDSDEYEAFMQNIVNWLPFKVDESANQRSRKWAAHPGGQLLVNDGKLLDTLAFVPKTQKNEQYLKEYQNIESLDNLERWFAQRIATGNRNNQMAKYAFALYSSGFDYADIERKVLSFNNQLSNKLTEDELRSTVLLSVAKKFQKH